ncbi:hypothetical protein J7M23_03830 [Candidatus Sumerlaeota bacterium]|nr:hypothetical protein [Candidatus Sumerlaeota bacterium]
MDVYDEAELYETGDIARAARNFGLMEAMIKTLGDLLKEVAEKKGFKAVSGYELPKGKKFKNHTLDQRIEKMTPVDDC